MKNLFIALLAVVTLSGCSAKDAVVHSFGYDLGVPITDKQMDQLIDGVSTKSDVKAFIGYPMKTYEKHGHEVWRYRHTHVNLLLGQGKSRTEVFFVFDDEGVLLKHYRGSKHS